jgi:hypothetical protein
MLCLHVSCPARSSHAGTYVCLPLRLWPQRWRTLWFAKPRTAVAARPLCDATYKRNARAAFRGLLTALGLSAAAWGVDAAWDKLYASMLPKVKAAAESAQGLTTGNVTSVSLLEASNAYYDAVLMFANGIDKILRDKAGAVDLQADLRGERLVYPIARPRALSGCELCRASASPA